MKRIKRAVVAAVISTLVPLWTGGWAHAACSGGPDVFTCLSEADYLAKAAELGYTTFPEGFEDDTIWGSVRSPSTASSVTSQGVSWTANYVQNEITTGSGARRTGRWGIYDPEHGFATGTESQCDIDNPPEHCLWYDGVTGTRVSGEGPLYAAGGYVRTSTLGANIAMILDDASQIELGKLPDADFHFFGVIDARGFTSFQVREIDGKIGQKFLIFGDDFTFAVSNTPVWPATAPARADHIWTFVDAASGSPDAVVVAGPPTYHGSHPGVVRLRNVSDLGFDVRFQEWDYRARDFADDYHAVEDIPYMVLQPGHHVMSDGSVWEVGTFDLVGSTLWQGVPFTAPFVHPPHLFLTVQTDNDTTAVAVRGRNSSVDGFEAAPFEEEALEDGHASETIG